MLVFKIIYLFSIFKIFSIVKLLQQSTAFCFKHFVIDSLPLMGRYFCKQISPFWPERQS